MKYYYILLITLISLLSSCQPKGTPEIWYDQTARNAATANYVQDVFKDKLDAATEVLSHFKPKDSTAFAQQFASMYDKSTNLVWQDANLSSVSDNAAQLLTLLEGAKQYGLSPETYQSERIRRLYNEIHAPLLPDVPDKLEKMLDLDIWLTAAMVAFGNDMYGGRIVKPSGIWITERGEKDLLPIFKNGLAENKIGAAIEALQPVHKGYHDLKTKLQQYEAVAQKGGWKPITANLRKGSEGEAVQVLASHLADLGDLEANSANTQQYNEAVEAAVKQYQDRHGLAQTGVVDAKTKESLNVPAADRIALIRLNMERYHWLPDTLGKRHVWVNIPEFMMRVVNDGEVTTEMRTVVGEYKTATPILVNKKMTNVVLSPTWTIPQSIAKEEMEWIRMDPSVLIVADVDVFLDGKEIDARKVDWKKIDLNRVKLRQIPKSTNSMGKVKFPFENNYGIYLHDTPNRIAFNQAFRAESHGCVRVHEPARLAFEMLKGKSNWTEDRIRAGMASNKEQYISLPEEVRVHIFYLTTWVDDKGHLRFLRDLYGHDRRQLKQMAGL